MHSRANAATNISMQIRRFWIPALARSLNFSSEEMSSFHSEKIVPLPSVTWLLFMY